MAKYRITYRCGHDGEKQLTGPHKDRESYVEWAAANKDCWKCERAARQAAEREAGPQFCYRIVPGHDAENARKAALQAAARAELEIELRAIDGRSTKYHTSGLMGGGSAYSYTDDARYAREYAQAQGKFYKSKPDAIEIACYAGSYEIREQLKARGWRFGEVTPPHGRAGVIDLMSSGTVKGWSISYPVPRDAEGKPETAAVARAQAELDWIQGNGWCVAESDRLGDIITSAFTGRGDLLGCRYQLLSDEAQLEALHKIRATHEDYLRSRAEAQAAATAKAEEEAKLATMRPVALTRDGNSVVITMGDGRVLEGHYWDDDGGFFVPARVRYSDGHSAEIPEAVRYGHQADRIWAAAKAL